MPAETKKSADSIAGPATKAAKPASSSSGKAALSKVTLLDGSVLEVSIDVSRTFVQYVRQSI